MAQAICCRYFQDWDYGIWNITCADNCTYFTNLQCLRYGGNAAVACYAAISYIAFPVQYFLTGIGEGVQPLISFYHGAKKETEVRAVKKIAYTAEIILGITAAAVTICMIPYIGGWFGLSAESKQYFSSGMLISHLHFC